jgi:hypothetical protein
MDNIPSWNCCIIGSTSENSFGILKKTFRKLLRKSDLHVTFLPYVLNCCCFFHNLSCNQGDLQVKMLMHILEGEEDSTQQFVKSSSHFNDPPIPHSIEGRERSKYGLKRKLTNYLGLQHDCT